MEKPIRVELGYGDYQAMELIVPRTMLLFFLAFLLFSALLFPSPIDLLVPSDSTPPRQSVRKPVDGAACLDPLKVYIVDLAHEFNCGLVEDYYKGRRAGGSHNLWHGDELREELGDDSVPDNLLPYPKNPNWHQYSAEYGLLADLPMGSLRNSHSTAVRVQEPETAEVFLGPFLCALSAEIQLGEDHARFRKMDGNRDYTQQREDMKLVTQTKEVAPLWWSRPCFHAHGFAESNHKPIFALRQTPCFRNFLTQ